jgi:hypothetical protein
MPEAALLHPQTGVLPGELSLPDSFRAVRGLRVACRQVGSAGGLVGGHVNGAAAGSVATSRSQSVRREPRTVSGARVS